MTWGDVAVVMRQSVGGCAMCISSAVYWGMPMQSFTPCARKYKVFRDFNADKIRMSIDRFYSEIHPFCFI